MPAEEGSAGASERRRRQRRRAVRSAPPAEPEASPAAEEASVRSEPARSQSEPSARPERTTPSGVTRARKAQAAPSVLPPPPPPDAVEPEPVAELIAEIEADPVYAFFWRSGLLNVLAIARREIGSLLVSPVGWVLGGVLVLFTSLLGYDSALVFRAASMSAVFGTIVILMLLFVPLYTMRLVAQERDSGTLEIILTSPVRDGELVVGKWLGGFGFFLLSAAFTLVYLALLVIFQPDRITIRPLGIAFQIASLDYGQILTGYVGLVLAGAMFVAVGVLTSSLTRSQIIAAVLALGALLLLWNAGAAAIFMRPPAAGVVDYLAGASHFNVFDKGAIALKDVVYFVTVAAAALFLATRVIEARKWA